MMNKKIVVNAGIVLQLMNNAHGLTYRELKEKSQFSDKELSMAIGWLACENKILFSSDDDKLYLNGYFYF
ncbi:winged helix-turn-helix domain-containing protein [Parabacteroides pacaensis]|uniref:winged helix-turn-helix domain-containing protein n=1 Tax=Parabacteroides pacaensis TaxID=2086575 RepID=UPI000D108CE8|nr:winged helix-turn-helix domain-containing protein [Parabacteroides pacaensis]